MKVPVPGLKQPIGSGNIIADLIGGIIGKVNCSACERRKQLLNSKVVFVPRKKGAS